MKAKEFINGKEVTAIETVEGTILNLVIDEKVYALSVDTSTIKAGTKLKRTTTFKIEDDILTAGKASVNLAEIDMLGKFEEDNFIES